MTEYLHLLLTAAHSTELGNVITWYITEDYGFVITKSRLQITKITKDYTGITGQAYEITATLRTPRF